ncbi:MAG TPA: MgtC/SapB family protein [Thermomicrobiaceae bacterium]|nr:MgtC/SapB family protein [Thermomicrobiaceae bacterium]
MLTHADTILLLRVLLAGVIGFLIGLQRETRGSPAGERTTALLAVGVTALVGIDRIVLPANSDRVIQGIITGVGFLGVGVIVRTESRAVHGLTTAAGLWAVMAMSVLVGLGHEMLGAMLGVLILLLLVWPQLPVLSRLSIAKRRTAQETSAEALTGTSPGDPPHDR